jgi:hypothetical protein
METIYGALGVSSLRSEMDEGELAELGNDLGPFGLNLLTMTARMMHCYRQPHV